MNEPQPHARIARRLILKDIGSGVLLFFTVNMLVLMPFGLLVAAFPETFKMEPMSIGRNYDHNDSHNICYNLLHRRTDTCYCVAYTRYIPRHQRPRPGILVKTMVPKVGDLRGARNFVDDRCGVKPGRPNRRATKNLRP